MSHEYLYVIYNITFTKQICTDTSMNCHYLTSDVENESYTQL